MRGCLSTFVIILSLIGCGGSVLVGIFFLTPLLLESKDVGSISEFHWYTWTVIIVLPLVLLKALVKGSRMLADEICDFLGLD